MNKSLDQKICNKIIVQGAVLRIILTFITFWVISKWTNPKYLFIILPIVLTVLDASDNIPAFIYSFLHNNKDICTINFEYQSTDKVNDLLSYVLAWYWFDLKSEPLFLLFCGLRAFGVLGFLSTKKSWPLMVFPDLLKEYLVYRFIIPQGFNWLPFVIIGKICFEIFLHGIVNKTTY